MDLGSEIVNLKLWDTAGQERYRTLTQTYYKGADAIFLVYDCTNKYALENIASWMKQIDTNSSENVIKIIVANKIDCAESRKISAEEGKALADKYGSLFFETSAKTGENVELLFNSIAENLAQQAKERPKRMHSVIEDETICTIQSQPKKKKRI